MTQDLDPAVEQFAGHLAALQEPGARDRAMHQLKLLVAATLPAEQLVPEPPVRSLGDYLAAEVPTPPELVTPKFLVRGGVTGTVARGGVGKTSLALNRLLPWAAGEPMFPALTAAFVPVQPLKILIIENEGSGGEFHAKITRMLAQTGLDRAQVLENVLIWGEGGYAGVKIDERGSYEQVERAVEKWGPDVVLMEPFARIWRGNENDNSEVNAVLDTLEELAARYDIAIMLAHHERKQNEVTEIMDRQRGASAMEGVLTFMEFFQRVKGDKQRELVTAKSRYAPFPPLVRMAWREDNSGWYDFVPPEAGVDEILALLDLEEPRFVADLAEELDEPEHRVRKLLKSAIEDGRARRLRSSSSGAGSSGNGYLLPRVDGAVQGEVSF